jgi:hypothetical protein
MVLSWIEILLLFITTTTTFTCLIIFVLLFLLSLLSSSLPFVFFFENKIQFTQILVVLLTAVLPLLFLQR